MKRYRGNRSQNQIADELMINRATVSLLENGKQVPSLQILQRFCSYAKMSPNSFFAKEDDSNRNIMTFNLNGEDNSKLLNVLKRIEIREKYVLLHRRCKSI